jgi:hypothetical protein
VEKLARNVEPLLVPMPAKIEGSDPDVVTPRTR